MSFYFLFVFLNLAYIIWYFIFHQHIWIKKQHKVFTKTVVKHVMFNWRERLAEIPRCMNISLRSVTSKTVQNLSIIPWWVKRTPLLLRCFLSKLSPCSNKKHMFSLMRWALLSPLTRDYQQHPEGHAEIYWPEINIHDTNSMWNTTLQHKLWQFLPNEVAS